MKTFLKLLILVPLALLAVAFAVANRQGVTVSLDPFATDVPAFALSGPLFVVVLVMVVAGVVIGGVATWLGQGRHRRRVRGLRRENDALRGDIARLKADIATTVAEPRQEGPVFPALTAPKAA